MEWPEELKLELARNRCVVFLGAGISMNSVNAEGHRPPSWKQFLLNGAARCNNEHRDSIQQLIDDGKYLMACELIKRYLGNERFNTLMRHSFMGYDHAEIHDSIYNLESRIVVTPSFDKIYETRAAEKSHNNITVKNYYDKDLSSFLRGYEQVIIKSHGTIDTLPQIIFTQSDYAKARVNHADFYQIMESLILTHTFLFLGAGLNDPDIQLLFENHATTFAFSKNHYFVIPEGQYKDSELQVYADTMKLEFVKYPNPNNDHIELTNAVKILSEELVAKKEEVIQKRCW